MRHFITLLATIIALLSPASCTCNRSADPAAGSGSAAAITEQQARQLGVAAAQAIAGSNPDDTLALQRSIVDAHATRSRMELEDNPDAARAFDEALRDELQRSSPALAAELFAPTP